MKKLIFVLFVFVLIATKKNLKRERTRQAYTNYYTNKKYE